VRYQVPELLLHAILMRENGRMGQAVKNKNGTYDMGLAQINTAWVPYFARFGVKIEHLMYDTCTNLQASAYILKDSAIKFQGDWFKAIVAYNIGPNNWTAERYAKGYRYASLVVSSWWGFQNWVDAHNHVSRSAVPQFAAPQAYQTPVARSASEQIISRPPQAAVTPAQPSENSAN
jgi:hypothetical protein